MWRRCCLFLFLCVTVATGMWQQIGHFRAGRKGIRMVRQQDETTETPNAHCICSKIYDPVCASNGKSYYNQCQMECENAPGTERVVHQGNCIPF